MTPRPPTQRQLAYLRALADRTGQTFVSPQTSQEASREIRRLEAQDPITSAERAAERQQLSHGHALAYGTAPVDDEIAGYGSRATWRTR